jgi:hypothetical protein
LGIQKDLETRAQQTDKSISPGTLRDGCECEALASLRYIYPGSFLLDPKDVIASL